MSASNRMLLTLLWQVSMETTLTTIPMANSRFAPNQWEMALLCNAVSHWLGAKPRISISPDTSFRATSDAGKEETLPVRRVRPTELWLLIRLVVLNWEFMRFKVPPPACVLADSLCDTSLWRSFWRENNVGSCQSYLQRIWFHVHSSLGIVRNWLMKIWQKLHSYHGFAMREASVNSTSLYETN